MDLNPENVRSLIRYCLFNENELGADGKPIPPMVKAEGITLTLGFHEGRVRERAADIASLCDQLPGSFRDGMSFSEMCLDREGRQWGEHRNMEELVLLGLASNKIKLLSPKEMWPMLPLGLPYYAVLEKGKEFSGPTLDL